MSPPIQTYKKNHNWNLYSFMHHEPYKSTRFQFFTTFIHTNYEEHPISDRKIPTLLLIHRWCNHLYRQSLPQKTKGKPYLIRLWNWPLHKPRLRIYAYIIIELLFSLIVSPTNESSCKTNYGKYDNNTQKHGILHDNLSVDSGLPERGIFLHLVRIEPDYFYPTTFYWGKIWRPKRLINL